LILDYAVDGKRYLEILKFDQQRRSASKCPPPLATDINCNQLLANAHLDVVVVEDVSDNTSAGASDLFLRASKAPTEGPTVDSLLADLSPQVVADFKALRKAKKAAITVTAIEGIRREASKAGVTLERALATCCERGWQSFKADWYTGQQSATAGPVPPRRKELA
jgi:hypothetical protein